MGNISDKEFDKLWGKINHQQGGQGDSPYTQDFVDELNGRKKKDKKEREK